MNTYQKSYIERLLLHHWVEHGPHDYGEFNVFEFTDAINGWLPVQPGEPPREVHIGGKRYRYERIV